MEYIQMPAASKGIYEKFIPRDGARVPSGTNGPATAEFRPMPLPVFSQGKSLSSAGMIPMSPAVPVSGPELSRGMPSVTSGIPANGAHMALVTSGNGGMGMMHSQVQGESESSLHGNGFDKGKRSRGDGGRGSRGGGTSSRKRTKAGQADSLTTSEPMPDGSLSGGAVPSAGMGTGGNGNQQGNNSAGEKPDKSTSRRQAGQGIKRGDKKQTTVATSTNDPLPPKMAESKGATNGWSGGILDIYGLRTRTVDVPRFMVDIPLEDLLSGNFEVPSFSLKESHENKEFQESFEQQVACVFDFLPKHSTTGEAHSSKNGDIFGVFSAKGSNNPKVLLDLECALHPEDEEEVSRVAKIEKETCSDRVSATKLESAAVEEARVGSAAVLSNGISPSRFTLEGLPLHSVEDFMSRLKLSPSEPLQSLIARAGANCDTSASTDNRTTGDLVDLCRKNGSIPPLSFSYPCAGPMKVENGRHLQRIWVRSSTADNTDWKGVSCSLGKEAPNGTEDEAAARSPSSKRQIDVKDKVASPDGMQVSNSTTQSSGRIEPSRSSILVDLSISIKEEPHQVENAVGSSGQNLNAMEIDCSRVDSGSTAVVCGAEETKCVKILDPEKGDKVATPGPLEAMATQTGSQMDIVPDCDTKPSANRLSDLKQEKVELPAKDPVEGTTSEPVAPKHEPVSTLPVDLKVNINVSSPSRVDSFSNVPAIPTSPGARAAARLLCSIANSTYHLDKDKIDGDREKRRRVFQPYSGAPAQKNTKSIRVSGSAAVPADLAREAKIAGDGGSISPPGKILASDRRKSLNQMNDASDKPSVSTQSFNGATVSTGLRGSHSGFRLNNNPSVKSEKIPAKESTKESSSSKELAWKSSSVSPVSNVVPLKSSHKGTKTNSHLHTSNSKTNALATNVSKVSVVSGTAQKVGIGGTSSRSGRSVQTGNLSLHGSSPVPLKSSRQGIPENRQKTKTEVPGRGAKPGRD